VAHSEEGSQLGEKLIASLGVQEREARRTLLFDEEGLMGWENQGSDRAPEGAHRVREPRGAVRRLSFTGIHVVEPRIFALSQRQRTFSIITLYLELAAEGFRILPVDVSAYPWIDVGTPERLAEAGKMVDTLE
jgi:MurNAc alpha-1-phosphate uridylyltransferase